MVLILCPVRICRAVFISKHHTAIVLTTRALRIAPESRFIARESTRPAGQLQLHRYQTLGSH